MCPFFKYVCVVVVGVWGRQRLTTMGEVAIVVCRGVVFVVVVMVYMFEWLCVWVCIDVGCLGICPHLWNFVWVLCT